MPPAGRAAKASGTRWLRPLWRLLDPGVPRTQAVRRLRAVVLTGTATLAAGGLTTATSDAPTESAAATSAAAATTTSSPPATIRPLMVMTAPGQAPVITRVETTDPVVFVTIDDGFTRAPEVATVLDELDMPATLFLVDRPVLDGAAFFRSLPDAVVEAHTSTHTDLRTLPEDAQRAEICGNADTVARTLGRRPVLFRPPYGNYNVATQRAAASCGMAAVVLWEESIQHGQMRFRSVREIRRGDIILLHFRPELPDDLRALAQQVEDAGLRVAQLEDYLAP
jgi:peptidoglycan/xylan/chitin deacetylase (PgdA/CDA1 family)